MELLDLIEQYLKKVTPDHCDDDGIVAVSYFLLGDVTFSDNLLNYSLSSASALAAFSKSEVLIHLKKYMSCHEIDILCDLLKRMIEFCNQVERNNLILAQFDQLLWDICDTSHISTEVIISYKSKYDKLIKSLNA
ncbi:hypothetical protein A4H97_33375 [Niastella yeongjuensis]|uniref:Uncharacterized protein n=2 Tax=Niastella yeongjuensis TaxID=354355 RepID=A0A1V9EDQ2_9BACT|nr:hypothetical protein A4H97_33375 [Niastella yeongjuensis]